MRDRDMVGAIVAGNPAGLAAAYDRHAADLHAYCRCLLAEPGAAEAVRDTFVIANAKMARLRDPDLARAWLFAVARSLCHRRLADVRAAAQAEEIGDIGGARADHGDTTGSGGRHRAGSGAVADQGAGAGRPAARELVNCAIRSLNAAERDAAELCVRHDISDAGLAATLGMSRRQAHTLVSRARKSFAASLGVLVVAKAGPQFCPDLASILIGWDGELTGPMRRRLHAHIRRCGVCGERKRRKLEETMLLGLATPAELPGEVWREILGLVSGTTPGDAEIAASVEPLSTSGFPVPPGPRAPARPPVRFGFAALAGLAMFAAIGAVAVVKIGPPHPGTPAHRPRSAPGVHAPQPATALKAPPAANHSRSAGRGTAASAPVRATTAPAPTAGPTNPTGPPTAGTLSVWPTTVTLTPSGQNGTPTGSFTLTANGGPVTLFTITLPAGRAADLTVVPSSGSLMAGQSVQITVTLPGGHHGQFRTRLDVEPGGLMATVVYRPAHG